MESFSIFGYIFYYALQNYFIDKILKKDRVVVFIFFGGGGGGGWWWFWVIC